MRRRSTFVSLVVVAASCASEVPETVNAPVVSTIMSTTTAAPLESSTTTKPSARGSTTKAPVVTTTTPVVADSTTTVPARTTVAPTTTKAVPTTTESMTTRLVRVQYGDAPQQVGDLRVPPGVGPFGVVVFVHGGFWRSGFDETLMTALAVDATNRGVTTWNFNYRSVGDPGGGYPGTLEDVALAMDHLAVLDEDLLLDDVTVIGHSAGGHLALWASSRHFLRSGDPGADPVVRPHTAVAQAAVVDLRFAAAVNMGGSAVEALLGGEPDEVPEHYRVAQPVFEGQRIIVVHGRYDQVVPISQSGLIDGAIGIFDDTGTHFDVLDPRHELWLRTVEEIGLD